jgi:ABC-type protease/lipase transport system fused ATPase/permease subunit
LGWLALGGGLVILGLSWLNQRAPRHLHGPNLAALSAERQAENLKADSELIQALGMSRRRLCPLANCAATGRWRRAVGSDVGAFYSV